MKAKTQRVGLPEPYRVVKCLVCGLERLSPQPTDEEYKHHYEQQSNHYRLDTFLEEAALRKPVFRYAADRLQSDKQEPGTVLDLGCAAGHFLIQARSNGWQAVGVEPTQQLREYAQKEYQLEVFEDFEAFKRQFQQLDAAHANHVVEHLKNPRDVLQEIFELLKPGGTFVLEVPNQFNSWKESLKILWIKLTNNSEKLRWWTPSLDSMHHTYFFTPKTMRAMLERVGYEVVDMTTSNPSYFETNIVTGVKRGFYRVMHSLAARVNRGPIINCVARKPRSAIPG